MTTIAYRDGVLAADRATYAGSTVFHDTQKVCRRADGALCGAAGVASIGAAFRRWFLAGEQGERPSLGEKESEDAHAIIVRADGKVEIHDRMGWVEAMPGFVAIGSGREIAIGAMAAGATAEEAVHFACEHGVGILGKFDSVRVTEPNAPSGSPGDEGDADVASGMTLAAEFDQDVVTLVVQDGKIIATLEDGSTHDVTDQVREAAVEHVVQRGLGSPAPEPQALEIPEGGCASCDLSPLTPLTDEGQDPWVWIPARSTSGKTSTAWSLSRASRSKRPRSTPISALAK